MKARAENTCQICGESRDKGMICHEVWHYDDVSHIATLTGFQLVCPPCNVVLHISGAGARKTSGFPGDSLKLDPTAISLDRLIEVNQMSFDEAGALLNHANKLLHMHSKEQWQVEIGSSVIAEFPFLAEIQV